VALSLLTGVVPAALIAVMLPFVPESQIWKERKKAGTLKRPSFAALFAPESDPRHSRQPLSSPPVPTAWPSARSS